MNAQRPGMNAQAQGGANFRTNGSNRTSSTMMGNRYVATYGNRDRALFAGHFSDRDRFAFRNRNRFVSTGWNTGWGGGWNGGLWGGGWSGWGGPSVGVAVGGWGWPGLYSCAPGYVGVGFGGGGCTCGGGPGWETW